MLIGAGGVGGKLSLGAGPKSFLVETLSA